MDTTINSGWKFHLGDENEAFYKGFDDSGWETVELPHDSSLSLPFDIRYSSGTGYLAGGTGWYRKHFVFGEDILRNMLCYLRRRLQKQPCLDQQQLSGNTSLRLQHLYL